MTYEDDIKKFRKEVDYNIKKSQEFLECEQPAMDCHRRMQIVNTKLCEAKMWLGKCLEAYGTKLPEEFRDECQKL